MTRIIYNALLNRDIIIDEKSALYQHEFAEADIGGLIFDSSSQNPVIIHRLIEVKYNNNATLATINQMKQREQQYQKRLLAKIEDPQVLREANIDQQALKNVNLTHVIESILFHNNPSEGLVQVCKDARIRLFTYEVGVSLSEIKVT